MKRSRESDPTNPSDKNPQPEPRLPAGDMVAHALPQTVVGKINKLSRSDIEKCFDSFERLDKVTMPKILADVEATAEPQSDDWEVQLGRRLGCAIAAEYRRQSRAVRDLLSVEEFGDWFEKCLGLGGVLHPREWLKEAERVGYFDTLATARRVSLRHSPKRAQFYQGAKDSGARPGDALGSCMAEMLLDLERRSNAGEQLPLKAVKRLTKPPFFERHDLLRNKVDVQVENVADPEPAPEDLIETARVARAIQDARDALADDAAALAEIEYQMGRGHLSRGRHKGESRAVVAARYEVTPKAMRSAKPRVERVLQDLRENLAG